jgi:hypothetical protein
MNLNPGQTNEFVRSMIALWREISGLVATWVFWLLMIGLLSSPAWLPAVIEKLIVR